MLTLAEKLRWAAAVLFVLGLCCMPLPRMNPKLALNAFSALAPAGWFMGLGLAVMAAAAAVFLLSLLVRR